MYYTESHEWLRIKGSEAEVGITNHAREELGEIVNIELPKIGKFVRAGDEVCVLESTKAATDIYSPVSGQITAVNDAVKKNPALLNQAAEKDGWLFCIMLSDSSELKSLLSQEQYLEFLH